MVSADVVQYDQATRTRAIKEIEGGYCPALTEFAKDFLVMRDQTRIVTGE